LTPVGPRFEKPVRIDIIIRTQETPPSFRAIDNPFFEGCIDEDLDAFGTVHP